MAAEGSAEWFARMADAYRAYDRAIPNRGPGDSSHDYVQMMADKCDQIACNLHTSHGDKTQN